MSSASVTTATVHGAKILPIRVEADIHPGLPYFAIIGLPDRRIEEAKVRVKSALRNSGFTFPSGTITVNLSPAEVPKRGTGFDLAIATALLMAARSIPPVPSSIWILGEISLDGSILAFQELPALLVGALQQEIPCIISCSLPVSSIIKDLSTIRISNLDELRHLPASTAASRSSPIKDSRIFGTYAIDALVGQATAKRAMEIAIAGRHAILLTGPVGIGKSRLGEVAYQLLPPITRKEGMQLMQINSASGVSFEADTIRPFVRPHHASSRAAMIGGGRLGIPGEVCRAHAGMLLLDELLLFKAETLESLREPFQNREIRIKRGGIVYEYPADCYLVATTNGCPCGYAGMRNRECGCSVAELAAYAKKLSGALYDRFAMHIQCAEVKKEELTGGISYREGREMAQRIASSQDRQYVRNGQDRLNSHVKIEDLLVPLGNSLLKTILDKAAIRFGLSGRGIESVLAVARTIADLEEKEEVGSEELTEALQYRRKT